MQTLAPVNPQVADQVVVLIHPRMGQGIEHRLQQVIQVTPAVVRPKRLNVYS
jgi:hypothetical protein